MPAREPLTEHALNQEAEPLIDGLTIIRGLGRIQALRHSIVTARITAREALEKAAKAREITDRTAEPAVGYHATTGLVVVGHGTHQDLGRFMIGAQLNVGVSERPRLSSPRLPSITRLAIRFGVALETDAIGDIDFEASTANDRGRQAAVDGRELYVVSWGPSYSTGPVERVTNTAWTSDNPPAESLLRNREATMHTVGAGIITIAQAVEQQLAALQPPDTIK